MEKKREPITLVLPGNLILDEIAQKSDDYYVHNEKVYLSPPILRFSVLVDRGDWDSLPGLDEVLRYTFMESIENERLKIINGFLIIDNKKLTSYEHVREGDDRVSKENMYLYLSAHKYVPATESIKKSLQSIFGNIF
jgi:hypothetical protein